MRKRGCMEEKKDKTANAARAGEGKAVNATRAGGENKFASSAVREGRAEGATRGCDAPSSAEDCAVFPSESAAENAAPVGYIDSVYCGSGVDGKGLRCVVFFAGCNLRCPFCHNPETLFKQGTMTDIDTLVSRLERYKGYFRRGGVTLSGGEPFLQKRFALALVSALHSKGIRCCFETNGYITDAELIGAAEYLIVDVKNQETDDLSAYEEFFSVCREKGTPVRITNVLVPGKNDGGQKLQALAALLRKYFPAEKVKFLPFRKLCEEKYAELKRPFPYADIREAEEVDICAAEKIFTE